MSSLLVRLIKNWSWPDPLRQTPGGKGEWGGMRFTLDPIPECDYVVVLSNLKEAASVFCPPENIWTVIQEPPNEVFAWLHRGKKEYSRIYTTDHTATGARYIHSQPALPWHVNKDYDFLASCPLPEKKRDISWITSNKANFKGHKDRMGFLEHIRGKTDFDLFGRGFTALEDKWDGLAPYRYSIAFENFSNPYYWSEKLADCFLAWTMPIYYGCTRITEYFPAEAMILLDINDPDAPEKIRDAVYSDRFEKNLDAIAEARRLVLEKYQAFPMLAREINMDLQSRASSKNKAMIRLKPSISPRRKAGFLSKLFHRLFKG